MAYPGLIKRIGRYGAEGTLHHKELNLERGHLRMNFVDKR